VQGKVKVKGREDTGEKARVLDFVLMRSVPWGGVTKRDKVASDSIYENSKGYRNSELGRGRELDFPGYPLVKAVKYQVHSSLRLRNFAISFSCLLFLLILYTFLLPHLLLRSPMDPCPATNSHLKPQSLQVKTS
jgi:hypothetical protein